MKSYLAFTMAILMVTTTAFCFSDAASEEPVHSLILPSVHTELKPGSGKEKTEKLCAICHSVDYITMQPAFSRTVWTAEVNKMIKVMGAPISEDDARVIIDYLVGEYGTGK